MVSLRSRHSSDEMATYWLTTSWSGTVHDLVRCGHDAVGRSELPVVGALALALPLLILSPSLSLSLAVPSIFAPAVGFWKGEGESREEGDSDDRGLHYE